MSMKRRKPDMLIPTLVMGSLALTLFLIAYFRGEGQHISGIRSALSMTLEIIPLLIFAFIIAGLVQVLLSNEIIARWVGSESGMRGIIIGSVAGGLCPGGPFVSLPIAAGLLRAGASMGTMVAFVTGWSVWAVSRLPMEVGVLGLRFTLIRLVCTAIFPPLAGLIAHIIFSSSE
jgi:uncharacterized membrane protein YraQ (UPF0718 family)